MGRARHSSGPHAERETGLWQQQHAAHRDPRPIVSQWADADAIDPLTLAYRVRGAWWDILDELAITLIVTREYEHLVQAFGPRRRMSYLPLPHPNGLAVQGRTLHIASTRNPNMVYDFAPCDGAIAGRDGELTGQLLPTHARYFPGGLYLHDIAVISGQLHGNAVGLNAVVRLESGGFEPVWWPRSIDGPNGPRHEKNYLQLNSIAAGRTLAESYFGASAATPSARRPGHLNFPVDGRGVIFSGATRDVVAGGLTRPHSARLRAKDVWVDNSGYGEVGRIVDGRFEAFAKLPGWTRGLLFHGQYLFVGTSRVLPRFRHYAPGLDPAACRAGVHVLDAKSGKFLGGVEWPAGNQLFAIESLPQDVTVGFPFVVSAKASRLAKGFGASCV